MMAFTAVAALSSPPLLRRSSNRLCPLRSSPPPPVAEVVVVVELIGKELEELVDEVVERNMRGLHSPPPLPVAAATAIVEPIGYSGEKVQISGEIIVDEICSIVYEFTDSLLQICSIVYEFTDSLCCAREKETKRQTLLELVDLVQSASARLPDLVQDYLVHTVSANIFHCLPPACDENTGSLLDNTNPEEEDPYNEPSWPQLQFVYELLLRYIVSSDTNTKIAKRCIDHSLRLLDLFNSGDPREREYMKTIVHRIYGKFMVHRSVIRHTIYNIFCRLIFETERHAGIGELLEIMGSIISGFALPMKEEHKLFLVRALIPLHMPECVGMFRQQLAYCITQFVEKDYKLADIVLLKYWPVTNCQKEVPFLGELKEVLEATQLEEFQR